MLRNQRWMPAGIKKSTRLSEVLFFLRFESTTLQRAGILHAFIFGSVARGDDDVRSYVDIAVEAAPFVGSPDVMDIEDMLCKRLGQSVHIVSKRGLRREKHATIIDEMIEAF